AAHVERDREPAHARDQRGPRVHGDRALRRVAARAARRRWGAVELIDRRMGWGPRRVIGVDLARGLAMIGMFGAHLNVPREVTVADPSTYLALVHGRSAILFALLA